jgi:nucleotide-binding universal stress UspA family protein
MNEIIKKIILCFDNSELSYEASEAALKLAKTFDSEIVGIHGYNVSMHKSAFRIIEPTLPAEYQKEEILQRQRVVHDSLIRIGMEKISLSYLKPLEDKFHSKDVKFAVRVKEGKNYKAINEVLSEEGGDLVVIGSSGFSGDGKGYLGSVCLRVLRKNNRNFLVIKKDLNLSNPRLVVCLDGSASAISALRMANKLAQRFNGELHLVYVFDSNIHKEIFERLKESVINEQGFSFNSMEQERMHDEFIDEGLARVGNMILDKAEKTVFNTTSSGIGLGEWGFMRKSKALVERGEASNIYLSDPNGLTKKVLGGCIYQRICDYASEVRADLVVVGRTGRHYIEGMDIGSVTENVLRFSPCSVFIANQEE